MPAAVLALILAAPPADFRVTLVNPTGDWARGIEALRRGDAREAADLLAKASRASVRARPHLSYWLARAELEAGRPGKALVRFDSLARRSSAVAARARWGAAEAAWALGRKSEARRRYLDALRLAPGEGDAGLALFRAGEPRRLAIEEPDHAFAAGVTVKLSPAERLARAKRLLERLRLDDAIRELDALPGAEARYLAGMARYRSRHAYAEAAATLLGVYRKLPATLAADALFHGARALSRADRDDEAIRWYREVVRRYPRSAKAPEAAYLGGWLEYNRSRYEAALAPLMEAARRYPRGKWAREARWIRAFALRLLARHAEALSAIDALLPGASGELDLGKLLYWKARSLDALGRAGESRRVLADVVRRFPLSWYGLLARQRAGASLPEASEALAPGAKAERDPLLALADELISVGLPDEAGRELRRGEKAYRRRHRGGWLPALLDRYRRAGDWNRVYLLGEVHGDDRAAYPLAYADLVEKYAPTGGNPDHWLYAIMRKESGFDPRDRSFADARGLLQMIPATSRRVAERVGMTYEEGTLYHPESNLRLGAWYIGRLFQKFKRQPPLGAAAYNAGPRPVMRWCDAFGTLPTDEFVERIPYNETREYAKKVTAVYARYRHLYAGEAIAIPERLDCKYIVDEIDY